MRNLILILLIAVGFIACEGDPGPMGPQGEPGYDGVLSDVVEVEIKPQDWYIVTDDLGMNVHFACDVDFEEITKYAYNNAIISVYLYASSNKASGLYPVPDTFPLQDVEANATYIVFYSYLYYEGGITFTLRYDDFATNPTLPHAFYKVLITY